MDKNQSKRKNLRVEVSEGMNGLVHQWLDQIGSASGVDASLERTNEIKI